MTHSALYLMTLDHVSQIKLTLHYVYVIRCGILVVNKPCV